MAKSFEKKYYLDLDNSNKEYTHEYFGSKKEAFDYAVEESTLLDIGDGYKLEREVSGFGLKNDDYIVLDPRDNTLKESLNNIIDAGYNRTGSLVIKYNDVWYGVKSHFHVHPSGLSYATGRIGVSIADLKLMNGRFSNIKMSILYKKNEWLLSKGNQFNKDGNSYSIKNLGSW